ncbi:precorrin-8X methylmutase [Hornefia butyriciproducens]|uniref:Precorrin-8X methylmutase n=1 Tax=Hornefia butyriciproducens TaxID=2652293 RepID=A0A6L5Y1R8_9FIRM|nr:precorrin-8X methylmutase [Hornefia butyriciproducens]MCI7412372.1 precorrin-8X methylmutase [Clostridiales bacterium]MDD6299607.1 precorrin-8X methylmutase [Hornefia butyriciproducens]MDY5422867.1 precorrin-8X methylmutase [Hornefia butyriciproducens]MDY6212178.1 precorrin-8X methylmutase [Hornefia butyriciproducens]MST50760.1 precorrin-8X methylmutase [Hornefia butyriciproducens]
MKIENIRPGDIEAESFRIIGELLGDRKLDPRYEHIIKRCIHTSADFDYADSLYFSEGAEERIARGIREGAVIVTDTKMAQAGINKTRIGKYGGQVLCYIGDSDVAEEAKSRGLTRSYVSMEKASRLGRPVIFAIGNAPTALMAICDLAEAGQLDPVAVIGVPVGFVNVEASKERLIRSGIPCIVARGRKGGSNIAACIVNAIQYSL